MHIQANQSLKNHNTFKIDVKAQYIVYITKQIDIATLRSDIKLASLPWIILGEGSNLLLKDDIQGVVVRCNYKKIKVVHEDKESIWLSVGGGMNWHDFVTFSVEHGYWGLENLALIPGSVGASPVQNIGAYSVESRDNITRVQTINLLSGERVEFRNSECKFNYRTSIFKQEYNNKLLVHKVTFKLLKYKYGHPNLAYAPLSNFLKDIPKKDLTPKIIYDAVIKIRQKSLHNPQQYGNVGSFFKNPIISKKYFESLQEKHPKMPHHETLDHQYKINAGWLIEQTGWKGKREGSVGVSEHHALVLINYSNASGNQILQMSQKIQEDVNQKFGIHLEEEVTII